MEGKYHSLIEHACHRLKFQGKDLPEKRQHLRDYLTQNHNITSYEIISIMDRVLEYELSLHKLYSLSDCHKYSEGLYLLGPNVSITHLQVDCIVNAANSEGLGCFRPEHKCIDNIIHADAGPSLRNECRTIMHRVKTIVPGNLIVTRGYCLPSKYVFHVVGPIYKEHTDKKARELLRQSYLKCIGRAYDMGMRSIAFCCISTGIFGFPKNIAAQIAIDVILESQRHCRPGVLFNLDVVLCLYTQEDYDIYRRILDKIPPVILEVRG